MHSLGASPRLHFGTPPFGKSVDMVDVCTQLMEQGSKRLGAAQQGFMLSVCGMIWYLTGWEHYHVHCLHCKGCVRAAGLLVI